MIKIDYAQYPFKTRIQDGNQQIFDELRKAWLKLTPEEWVRQHFVHYMVSRNIPASVIALEKSIRVGELNKRFDILVYDRSHNPWMMVECKSMDVQLSSEVLHQLLRYNLGVPVKYLLITNGNYCMGFTTGSGQLMELSYFPEYE
jgi:hypothetical protein